MSNIEPEQTAAEPKADPAGPARFRVGHPRVDVRPAYWMGVPVASWFFGVRVWAAMMLALYGAFWLQIDGAASAATCVAILAQQTRGQAYEKAFYRLVGTIVGVCAALIIAGLFPQTRDLYIISIASWIALSVYVAGLLDGNRAYGAQLSGYTVANVGVQLIDAPQSVFLAGLNRTAAILVGIVAIGLVNDLLSAPRLQEGLLKRLRAVQVQTRLFAQNALRGGLSHDIDSQAARLLASISTLHLDFSALSPETLDGTKRSAAARGAALALIDKVHAVRNSTGTGTEGRASTLTDLDRKIEAALLTLETGKGEVRSVRVPIFRSRVVAARNALRTLLILVISGGLFALAGWPSTSVALALIAVTITLSSTAPNPRSFARAAAIAMPAAVVAAGVTEFIVLDGVADFPLLAIAMAPTILLGCLMAGSGAPRLAPVGFLLLVFFPVLLSPTNPQNYNPQNYLTTAVMAICSVAVLCVGLTVVLPTDDDRKRQWFLASAWSDVFDALDGRRRSPEASARDSDRISQSFALSTSTSSPNNLATLFWMADLTEAAIAIHRELSLVPYTRRADTLRALRTLDAPMLQDCGSAFSGSPLGEILDRTARLIAFRPDCVDLMLGEAKI